MKAVRTAVFLWGVSAGMLLTLVIRTVILAAVQ